MALAREPELTKVIYAENIDTRLRLPYIEGFSGVVPSTPSNFAIEFTEPIRRVGVIQLGDFAMGCDPRYVVEDSRRHLQFSEPIFLTTISSVTLEERVEIYENQALITITAPIEHAIMVPKTYNEVVELPSVVDAGSSVSVKFAEPHFLSTVYTYYPEYLKDQVALRTTRYHNGDPYLFQSNSSISTPNIVKIQASYLSGLANSAGTNPDAIFNSAAGRGSYLHTPAMTVPEWCDTIQRIWNSTIGGLAGTYNLRFNSITGEVNFWISDAVQPLSRDTYSVVSASLTVRQYDIAWWLGMDSVSRPIQVLRNTDFRDGNFVSLEPYVYRFYPRVMRTMELQRNSPSITTLLQELNDRNNGLYISPTLTVAQRSLHYKSSLDNVARTVTVPAGHWRADVFPKWLERNMIATYGVPPSVVTLYPYSVTLNPYEGRYKISTAATISAPFELDFRPTLDLARALGFINLLYAGTTSYIADQDGRPTTMYWNFRLNDSVVQELSMQRNLYRWSGNIPAENLRLALGEVNEGTTTVFMTLSAAATTPLFESFSAEASPTTGFELVSGFQPYDLVRLTNSLTNRSYSMITSVSNTDGIVPNQVLFRSGALNLSADLNIGSSPAWFYATKINRPAYVVYGGRPRPTSIFSYFDPVAYSITNRTEPYLFHGAAYGPLSEVIGLNPYSYLSLNGIFELPNTYCLQPPDYMLLEIVQPRGQSTRNALRRVVYGGGTADPDGPAERENISKHILAKLIVTDGFAKISEEMVHVSFTKPTTVYRCRFRILNPDFTLVDFHGRDVNFTLLMRAGEGKAEGLAIA